MPDFVFTTEDVFTLNVEGMGLTCELCGQAPAVVQIRGVLMCQACRDDQEQEGDALVEAVVNPLDGWKPVGGKMVIVAGSQVIRVFELRHLIEDDRTAWPSAAWDCHTGRSYCGHPYRFQVYLDFARAE